jgi:small subunit ribosomal protein S17
MTDEEQKKEAQDEGAEQAPAQDEDAVAAGPDAEEAGGGTAEGSDVEATGPVAEEGTPPSPGGEPTSTPPVEDESEVDGAPAEEKAAEADPEDELPWKERRRLERSRRPHEPKPQQTAEERKAGRVAARKAKAVARRKERAAAKGKKVAGTGTPAAEREGVAAKVRQGIVTSDKGEKTIVVRIDTARRHPTYEKVVRRSRTLHAHDERNEAGEGDVVRVIETRPLSKTKRWRLVEVLEKAK